MIISIITLFLVICLVLSFTYEGLLITSIFLLYLVLHLLFEYTTRIIISEDTIQYKSLIRTVRFSWDEVKSIGVITVRPFVIKVEEENIKKFTWWGPKRIYVSSLENHFPEDTKTQKNYFNFDFRLKIWELILQKVDKRTLD